MGHSLDTYNVLSIPSILLSSNCYNCSQAPRGQGLRMRTSI